MYDFEREIAELWAQVQYLKDRMAPADPAAVLRVPDIVEFVSSPEYLAMDLLYPKQLLVLKVHFLQRELLTADDLAMIAEWSQGFAPPAADPNHPVPHYIGEHGICPDILERIDETLRWGAQVDAHGGVAVGTTLRQEPPGRDRGAVPALAGHGAR